MNGCRNLCDLLCDYYVKSSSKSFLVGFQKFGYTNLNIIKKLLYIGVRYIEINDHLSMIRSDSGVELRDIFYSSI